MIKPPDLIGHISLDFRVGTVDTKDIIPVKPVIPFQRMRDAKARDAHEVTIMLPSHNTVRSFSFPFKWRYTHAIFPQSHLYIDEASNYSTEELLNDHTYFVQPLAAIKNGDVDPSSLKSKVSELQSEVDSLREQLCKAKDINDTMWDNIVKRLVSQVGDPEPPTNGVNESMEDQRRKKREKILESSSTR